MTNTMNRDTNVNVKSDVERDGVRIGELSKVTGVSTRSLRYYEEQGLLASVRLSNGYRDYGEKAARQVAFIQDLYSAGIPSDVIREVFLCAASAGGEVKCAEILVRVWRIRDELARQEQQAIQRREMLDRYLSGAASPAGLGIAILQDH